MNIITNHLIFIYLMKHFLKGGACEVGINQPGCEFESLHKFFRHNYYFMNPSSVGVEFSLYFLSHNNTY